MQSYTIGIMIPTSGILPMGKHFDRAFRKAIEAELLNEEVELEIITKMIGQGVPSYIEKALDEFIGYHDVDMVVGLVSNKVIDGFVERFEKKGVPLLINNLGEHFIPTKGFNANVIVNSEHLWQHSWALGRYAAQSLGKKGLIISSVYDAGYAFINCFQLGILSVDEGFDHDLRLLPMPEAGSLSDIKLAFEMVDMSEYDFVIPLFCGEEARLFLEEFYGRGYHEEISLVGLPFLLETKEKHLPGLEVYSTAMTGQPEGEWLWRESFAKMGESSGKATGRAIRDTKRLNTEGVVNFLKEIKPGINPVSTDIPRLTEDVLIVRLNIEGNNHLNFSQVGKVNADISNDEKIVQSRDSLNSAWMNSYLAV